MHRHIDTHTTDTNTYTYTHTHYMHIHVHRDTHIYTGHMHICMHTHMLMPTHAHICIHVHMHTYSQTHLDIQRTCTMPHTYIYAQRYTHGHTFPLSSNTLSSSFLVVPLSPKVPIPAPPSYFFLNPIIKSAGESCHRRVESSYRVTRCPALSRLG